MTDRIKQIPAKLLEFWNKYTSKQKAVIISVIAVIVLAFILLYVIVTKTQYMRLTKFESAKSANELVTLLQENGIKYKRSTDGTAIDIDKKKYTDAVVLMETNNLSATGLSGLSWEQALENSMSTTNQERQIKSRLALENQIRQELINRFDTIEDAAVHISLPDSDNTIFSEKQEASLGVILTLTEDMTEEAAASLAKVLARGLGNKSTDKITIIDSKYQTLFSGGDESGLGGTVSSIKEYVDKLRVQFSQNVKEVLLADNFQEVQIGSANLQFDMDTVTENYTEYTIPEGTENGAFDNTYEYSAKGATISGGIPGTDSNGDETDVMIESGGNTNSEVLLNKILYKQNTRVQNIIREKGAIKPEESSIAIVLTQYQIYDQAAMEDDGSLNGLTWDQFVAQNNVRTQGTVDEHVVPLIAAATGIAENNIQVSLWNQPVFQNKITKPFNVSNYLMIILAVLIIALLIFVVFKGTAPVEVTELEPELSVEQLLATTKENQSLEDIEFNEASETKKLIDKFVDENPDAVANLLRNWLNEDWG